VGIEVENCQLRLHLLHFQEGQILQNSLLVAQPDALDELAEIPAHPVDVVVEAGIEAVEEAAKLLHAQ
jgi:hypothetical protein